MPEHKSAIEVYCKPALPQVTLLTDNLQLHVSVVVIVMMVYNTNNMSHFLKQDSRDKSDRYILTLQLKTKQRDIYKDRYTLPSHFQQLLSLQQLQMQSAFS